MRTLTGITILVVSLLVLAACTNEDGQLSFKGQYDAETGAISVDFSTSTTSAGETEDDADASSVDGTRDEQPEDGASGDEATDSPIGVEDRLAKLLTELLNEQLPQVDFEPEKEDGQTLDELRCLLQHANADVITKLGQGRPSREALVVRNL